MDAPEKERLVLKRSILGLANIIVHEERLFEQTKRDVRNKKGYEILWSKIYACLRC